MTGTTWNPSDKTSGITLSGGNLIATANTFNFNGMRGTTSKDNVTGGAFYFEVTCNGSFSDGRSFIGFGLATAGLGTTNSSASLGGINEAGTNIQVAGFDPRTVALGAFPSKTYGVAIDITNKKYWFTSDGTTWNAGGTANPATGVGGGTWTIQLGAPIFIMGSIIDTGAAMTLNPGPSSFLYTIPSGFVAWDAATGVTGTWASTEAPDTLVAFGQQPPSGTLAATESADSWSTSSGFTRLDIENVIVNNGTPLSFTTNGPDRILVLYHYGVSVVAQPNAITSITDSAGLTWQGESRLIAGQAQNSENVVIELWWAYAHNKVTSDALTVTVGSGGSTTENWIGFAVKGLNGNYNYPFDSVNNPFSWGSAIGAFSGSNTVPTAFSPYEDGPPAGVLGTYPTFLSGSITGATLSAGNLKITSTGSGNPNNFATLANSASRRGGRYYLEVTFDNINGADYGAGVLFLGNILTSLITTGLGGLIVRGSGHIFNGTDIANLGVTPANGDKIGFAFDFDHGRAWAKDITQSGFWNGDVNADPVFNHGGIDISSLTDSLSHANLLLSPDPVSSGGALPIGVVAGTSSAAMTFNFGATSFTGTAPTGYLTWADLAPSGHFAYPAISIAATMSITASVYATLDTFPGFTQGALSDATGSQRAMASLFQYRVRDTNVSISDNEVFAGTATAPIWTMLFDTIVGKINPGSWDSTEAQDVPFFRGYPGAFGIVGDLTATEQPDIAAIVGFERDSGIWFSIEAPDIFGATGRVPLVGHLAATENPDIFAGVGLGRGENGTWISTEGVDTLTIIGNTPITAVLSAFEIDDRFVAFGAGVTHTSRRRPLIVT